MPNYQDFLITVNGSAEVYTVEARGPGEISVPPVLLAWPERVGLSAELERIKYGDAPSRDRMQAVGTLLFNALLPRKIARALARAYDDLPPGTHLRLKLAIRPPELNTLPWELLYDPDEETFLATRLTTPIVRLVESGAPSASLLAPRPLRVLYLQSTPADLPPLDLAASENALRAALGKSAAGKFAAGGLAEVTVVRAATPAALREMLRQPFHILHYDGHAAFDSEAQSGSICLQDAAGNTHLMSGEMLATLLDGSAIRLVVLAACESGMDSGSKRFAGIAQQLMKSSSLPAVVAMQFSIPDSSAIAFTGGFYGALADDYPVDAAVTEGRKAILEGLQGETFSAPDWATPVLFLRSADGAIFNNPSKSEEKSMSETKKTGSGGIQIGNRATIQGDVFTGGKKSSGVSIGSISNVSGGQLNIAGGDIHNVTQTSTPGELTIAQAFEKLAQKVNSLPEGPAKMMANTAVQGLKSEAEKGEQAEEKNVEQWFTFLAQMAPDVLEIAAATFANPIVGLGVAFKKIASKAKQ